MLTDITWSFPIPSQEEATAAVHLTPDIILHFRVEDGQAVSLIFNNFDHLILSDEYGPRAFRLEVERWPEPLRAVVWRILASAPVNEWLTVSSYYPPRAPRAIPLGAVRPVFVPPVKKVSENSYFVNLTTE